MPTLEKMAANGLRYNRLPHDGTLQPDARRAADRPQPPHQQRRARSWNSPRIPGQHRHPAGQRDAARADPAHERYSTAAFGKYHETPPWEGLGLGSLRSLADRLGLRQVLRLHRRRDQPVGARDLRRRDARRARQLADLPLHDRHDEPGHQVGERASIR
jgi:hypothetical protein